MALQLSKKAALPLSKILATCRNNVYHEPLKCQSPIFIQDPDLLIMVPAAVLALNTARPSADTVLTTTFFLCILHSYDIIHDYVNYFGFDAFIQNG